MTEGNGTRMAATDNAALMKRAERMAEKLRSRLSPAGTLGLPELLDKRRLQYGIPDGAFRGQALFDKVIIYQIVEDETHYEGTSIAMPEIAKTRTRNEACRGVLCGAGLGAMKFLVSNGVQLGHIVNFMRLYPWRKPCESVDGADLYVVPIEVGSLIDSEDLRQELLSRRVVVEKRDDGSYAIRGEAAPMSPYVNPEF